MAHETPTIKAEVRERIGTRYAQRLRNAGRLPCVIYGHKIDPLAISVDETEMVSHLHHGAHVVNVVVDGKEPETCLVKDIQFGYLGDNVIHVDLARVDLDEEVTVNVSLHFVGESPALKVPGAVLNHPLTDLEVICKVNQIPDEIIVDMSGLESTMTVGDLVLPEGVRTEIDPSWPVCVISYVSEEEAEGEAAEVAEEEVEPEVISEAKEEGEEAADAPEEKKEE